MVENHYDDIKNTINLLTTKIDNQNESIIEIKKNNDFILKKLNGIYIIVDAIFLDILFYYSNSILYALIKYFIFHIIIYLNKPYN